MKVSGHLPIDKLKIHRILIRATNWVGDVVMTMPALEAVREHFPDRFITVLARPWVVSLFENHPAVDQVIPFMKEGGYLKDLVKIFRQAALIRRLRFDLAVLFQNAFEAAMLTYLGGIRYRVGYNTDGRGFLLSHAVVRDRETLRQHQVEYYLSMLRAMGWEARSRDPSLFVADKHVEAVQSLLESHGIHHDDRLLGLSPGAIFGPAKRWPIERFAAIGDWAVERWGTKVLVIGSEAENDLCEALGRSMKHKALNLCGMTNLGEAMALIKRCYFFVCNDSGLMHVATALNVPTVAIFGSTDPVATGPRGKHAKIVREEMDCSPCLKPECSIGYRCLFAIEPEDVWKEMENLRENQVR